MSGPTVTLRPARDDEHVYISELLAAADLPTADVDDSPATFYVANAGDERVGIGGLECYDDAGLLRSVVVEEGSRGTGVGTALTHALEAQAAAEGVETLYLLTTTAADFFAKVGYEEIDREQPPEAIQQTTEFADLCPSNATCMRNVL